MKNRVMYMPHHDSLKMSNYFFLVRSKVSVTSLKKIRHLMNYFVMLQDLRVLRKRTNLNWWGN